MHKRLILSFFLYAVLSNGLLAETYNREYTYNALVVDTEVTSRITAYDQVRILLLLKIGAHIQQTIKISEEGSNNSYARDDVEAVTANLTEINILEEKWDNRQYYIKAEVEADTNNILDALAQYKNDLSEESQQLLEALKINEQVLKKSRENISRLRKELRFAKTDTAIASLAEKYIAELNRLSTEEEFIKGFKHHQRGEYSEAISLYLKAATEGNTVAQQLLGTLYLNGQGTKQDSGSAIYWFDKAAAQKEAIAQYYLGMLYFKGDGVERDNSAAAEWLHKSADQGYTPAQYQLGSMYLDGNGVEQKYYMAVHWFRMAAEHRDAKAQYALGQMYAQGKGVVQNESEAIYWYRKAAELGLNEAKQMIKEIDK
jgi:TPR repeat protein